MSVPVDVYVLLCLACFLVGVLIGAVLERRHERTHGHQHQPHVVR